MHTSIVRRNNLNVLPRDKRMVGLCQYRYKPSAGRSAQQPIIYRDINVGDALRVQVVIVANEAVLRTVQVDLVELGRTGKDVARRKDERRTSRLVRADINLARGFGDVELRHDAELLQH